MRNTPLVSVIELSTFLADGVRMYTANGTPIGECVEVTYEGQYTNGPDSGKMPVAYWDNGGIKVGIRELVASVIQDDPPIGLDIDLAVRVWDPIVEGSGGPLTDLNELRIDWGDGSPEVTVTGPSDFHHEYGSAGTYEISVVAVFPDPPMGVPSLVADPQMGISRIATV
jgi:hypothetical protein